MKKSSRNKITEQDIVIYQGPKGPVSFRAQVENDTMWATQAQIAMVFGVKSQGIVKHLSNIYKEGELNKRTTSSKMELVQNEGNRLVKRSVEFYNLDAIIAVGYRVNSKQATAFRIWATETLRDYLLHGCILNKKRLIESKQNNLRDLLKTVNFIQGVVHKKILNQDEVSGILQVIREYTNSFILLDAYDKGELVNVVTKSIPKNFSYIKAREDLDVLKNELKKRGQASELFSKDRNQNLEGIITSILLCYKRSPIF